LLAIDGDSKVQISGCTAGSFNVGYNGNGTVNLVGTGTANLPTQNTVVDVGAGSAFVARELGSVGRVDMSAGSVLNADFVGIGVNAKAIGGVQSNSGAGTLVLNNSTINTTHFELGANGVLTGDEGVIEAGATGPVIIGGTIMPGNSPGRIRIRCDITTLAGSRLILDIDDTGAGFDIDELIIGNDSRFNLEMLQIVFNFIGAINPDEFAKTGGFNLENFLRAEKVGSTQTTGLSALFDKNGNNYANWDEVLSANNFSAVSDSFDVSDFSLDANGNVTFVATAVPEPASIALVLLALLAMAAHSRRRAARRV
jgi:hypothetical protein